MSSTKRVNILTEFTALLTYFRLRLRSALFAVCKPWLALSLSLGFNIYNGAG